MKYIGILLFILTSLPIPSYAQNSDAVLKLSATKDFSLKTREGKAPNRLPYTPFHIEKEWDALAGDDLNFPFHMASAEGLFTGKPGIYTVSLNTLTERDGECAYNVFVNDKSVGLCQKNPPTNEFCAPAVLKWTGIEIPANAKIRVESNSYSNLKRPESNFFEYARGRWTGIDFIPEHNSINTAVRSEDLGIFEHCVNVGTVEFQAKTKYHKTDLAYFLVAGGAGLKEKQDNFGYLYKSVNGNFILEACVKIIGLTDNISSSAGLMMRQSLSADAPYIACLVQKNGLVTLKYRSAVGETIKEFKFKVADAEMIEIEKKGDSYTVSAAKFGETYERNTIEVPGFSGPLMIGFFVNSDSRTDKEAACFSNLRIF